MTTDKPHYRAMSPRAFSHAAVRGGWRILPFYDVEAVPQHTRTGEFASWIPYLICYEIWAVNAKRGLTVLLEQGHQYNAHDFLGVIRRLVHDRDLLLQYGRPLDRTYRPFVDYSEVTDLDRLRGRLDIVAFAHNTDFDGCQIELGAPKSMQEFRYTLQNDGVFRHPEMHGKQPYSCTIAFEHPDIFEADAPQRTVLFNDYTNFQNVSLKALGEACGLPKLERPEPTYEQFCADRFAVAEESLVYCRRDVEILRTSCLDLIQMYAGKLGIQMQLTSSQASLAAFVRSEYASYPTADDVCWSVIDGQPLEQPGGRKPHLYPIGPENPISEQRVRESYSGGRTECYWTGRVPARYGTIVYRDVNSMYPSAMVKNEMPIQLLEHACTTPLGEGIKQHSETHISRTIAACKRAKHITFQVRVDLIIDPRKHPFGFCAHHLPGRGVCFPAGYLKGKLLWEHEYLDAIKHRMVCSGPQELLLWGTWDIFGPWIRYLYAWRKDTRKGSPENLLVKMLLNQLFGKFGTRERGIWEAVSDDAYLRSLGIDPDDLTCRRRAIRQLDADVDTHFQRGLSDGWYEYGRPERLYVPRSAPQIASLITSQGRMIVLRECRRILADGQIPFYTDTDSVYCTDGNYGSSDELGGWSEDGRSAPQDCAFYAPKHLFFDGKATIKGQTAQAVADAAIGQTTFKHDQFVGNHRTLLGTQDFERLALPAMGSGIIRGAQKTSLGINQQRSIISQDQDCANEPLYLDSRGRLCGMDERSGKPRVFDEPWDLSKPEFNCDDLSDNLFRSSG